jgi:hypothetical protein
MKIMDLEGENMDGQLPAKPVMEGPAKVRQRPNFPRPRERSSQAESVSAPHQVSIPHTARPSGQFIEYLGQTMIPGFLFN